MQEELTSRFPRSCSIFRLQVRKAIARAYNKHKLDFSFQLKSHKIFQCETFESPLRLPAFFEDLPLPLQGLNIANCILQVLKIHDFTSMQVQESSRKFFRHSCFENISTEVELPLALLNRESKDGRQAAIAAQMLPRISKISQI